MKQKIGIWGLGIVGKSFIRYFSSRGYILEVLDKRQPTTDELLFLKEYKVPFIPSTELLSFLERNERIAVSPGINVLPYTQYAHKWIAELDIFSAHWRKALIAVTGTVGKTSIVHFLSKAFEHMHYPVVTGGNIGIGMLDLIQDTECKAALLELSSFQLEHCTTVAPDIAVWTNFYSNHLDRHGSLESYFAAKYKLIAQQENHHIALLPWSLYPLLPAQCKERNLSFFSLEAPLHNKPSHYTYYFIEDGFLVKWRGHQKTHLYPLAQLPFLSYPINWLIISAILDIMTFPLEIFRSLSNVSLPEHRLQCIGTIKGALFYNDSKATIPEATLAALEQHQGKRIHLFLGGVSKGVDRTPLIAQLQNKVASIVCFGSEASELYRLCLLYNIPAQEYTTLEEAFFACIASLKTGDIVLFSPAGASFDLFSNYQERGERFKTLVKALEGKL